MQALVESSLTTEDNEHFPLQGGLRQTEDRLELDSVAFAVGSSFSNLVSLQWHLRTPTKKSTGENGSDDRGRTSAPSLCAVAFMLHFLPSTPEAEPPTSRTHALALPGQCLTERCSPSV